MKPYVGAVLVAAGKGSRLKSKTRKARIQLFGRPLFSWALRTLDKAPETGEICLVAHALDVKRLRAWVEKRNFRVPVKVVAGGARRQDSVAAGTRALSSGWRVILVQDAARPFTTVPLARECAVSALKFGSGIAAVPVKDSIKQVKGGRVASLPRHELWAAQTPQACRAFWLHEALAWAGKRGKYFTDEAGLLEAFGKPVRLVKGSDANMKITTPQDLAAAKNRGGRG